ncbi:MAG TPA: PAP fibrillin [Cyanobacteria bacterium UBA8543]|nr:PAP fibrillin [Cyanobacteria bacterium UBA8543]
MVETETVRATLKTELFRRVDALEPQQALFPSKEEFIDGLVQQLEYINPIPQPLQPKHLPTLLGDWQLVYASRGTVVTRQLASIPNFLGGIKIKQVWQKLATVDTQKIVAENGAEFDLPLLGEWQLKAQGVWTWGADEQVATVTFNAFYVQATQPFDQPSWSLPELKIPVLEFLRNEALWTTSYLDEEMRVGRGATGNLFVFRRSQTV